MHKQAMVYFIAIALRQILRYQQPANNGCVSINCDVIPFCYSLHRLLQHYAVFSFIVSGVCRLVPTDTNVI